MRIGSLDTSNRVLVIAEIGNNHEGHFDVAMALVDAAAACGVDAVKFQTAHADRFIGATDEERRRRFASYEFQPEQWSQLAARARARRLLFLSTPLDLDSLALLTPLVDGLKVASGDVTFLALLDAAASSRKPIVLSSGASTLDEVVVAASRIRDGWRRLAHDGQLAVLHCVSAYPTPPEQAGLRTIVTLSATLDATIGYSDHVLGIDAAVAAVALGARVIEKHFTLDKHQSAFRDHQLSADPDEMTELVRRIRAIEPMLGSDGKPIQDAERSNRSAIRRSAAAAKDLPIGHVLEPADVIWVRPGSGLAPGEESRLMGRALVKSVRSGTLLSDADVS